MHKQVRVDLPMLAKREYLHGTTLFNAMIDACGDTQASGWLNGAVIASFKLVRESHSNGRFEIAEEPRTDIDANATMQIRGAPNSLHCYFIEEGRAAPRQAYDEESFYKAVHVGADFSGEFSLPMSSERGDFIRGIVGANKLVHQRAACFASVPQKIRFVYLADLPGACVEAICKEPLSLGFANLSTRQRGSDVWTINRLTLKGKTSQFELRLCFVAS